MFPRSSLPVVSLTGSRESHRPTTSTSDARGRRSREQRILIQTQATDTAPLLTVCPVGVDWCVGWTAYNVWQAPFSFLLSRPEGRDRTSEVLRPGPGCVRTGAGHRLVNCRHLRTGRTGGVGRLLNSRRSARVRSEGTERSNPKSRTVFGTNPHQRRGLPLALTVFIVTTVRC